MSLLSVSIHLFFFYSLSSSSLSLYLHSYLSFLLSISSLLHSIPFYCSKIVSKSLYYSTVSVKFHQNWQGENSPFLLHFLFHIHVLMLCRKFELIPIKIGFFNEFLKLLENWAKVPVL